MKSLVGKKYIYIPIDNSWSVNVANCGDFLSQAKRCTLAGNYKEYAKECIISSEPFDCNTYTTGLLEPKSNHKMIMVEYNQETYMVLFYKSSVISQYIEYQQ